MLMSPKPKPQVRELDRYEPPKKAMVLANRQVYTHDEDDEDDDEYDADPKSYDDDATTSVPVSRFWQLRSWMRWKQ